MLKKVTGRLPSCVLYVSEDYNLPFNSSLWLDTKFFQEKSASMVENLLSVLSG